MCDKLVFDLAQEVEGTPNVFVRKDWINILDNQTQNYSNNQSIIDTSQLSNSNKYMSYRESYLSVPLLITMASIEQSVSGGTATIGTASAPFTPSVGDCDLVVGLKNWYGQIFHSMTLDYNGTTIIQQTPYSNMWNTFKLLTSLSLGDLQSQGAIIGFFPDDATSWTFAPAGAGTGLTATGLPSTVGDSIFGNGLANNTNSIQPQAPFDNIGNSFRAGAGNKGFLARQNLIAFDTDAQPAFRYAVSSAGFIGGNAGAAKYDSFITKAFCNNLWKSYVSTKIDQVITASTTTQTTAGQLQYSIVATVYLKHLHSFFNMCPLLKGVFMKMTLNLNNTSSTIIATASQTTAALTVPTNLQCSAVANPLGGVNPIMIASGQSDLTTSIGYNAGYTLFPLATLATSGGTVKQTYVVNVSVGSACLDQSIRSAVGSSLGTGQLSRSVYLYVPAMTFNPTFEQAYLSSPIKQIKYTDIYQYQVLNTASGATFNNLITNGIANIKSVLIIPFFSSTSNPATVNTKTNIINSLTTGFINGYPVFQSPFDPAGCGCTSPLSHITNFNVQVSGQNAIYNTQRYVWEQFNDQLYGQNAVNGGLTDGLTSGLIGREEFDMEYCYYYVNVERMLPVEMSVPKSIQILGQNQSAKAMDYWVFVEYGVEISIDSLTGARV
jgi:hypothetical protein